jgi:hypothetical protein
MIVINTAKAVEVAKDQIRAWRESEFTKNDVALQNAMVDEDSVALQEAKDRRDYLRDLPQQCEGKNLEELKQILLDLE